MNIIVDMYPHRDSILKSSGAAGGGSAGAGSGIGQRTISRDALAGLSPAEQATTIKAVREGTVTLTD